MPEIDPSYYRTQAAPVASPSLRVHRVFHRLGAVFGGLCLLVTLGSIGFAIFYLLQGNRDSAISAVSLATIWFLVGAVIYILCRSIGWIIAGAMKY